MHQDDFYSTDTRDCPDVSDIAVRVAKIIEAWLAHHPAGQGKRTQKVLSRELDRGLGSKEVNADAIRQFLRSVRDLKAGSRDRINRKNDTLQALYNFILREYHTWPQELQQVYLANQLGPKAKLAIGQPQLVDPELKAVALGAQSWLTVSAAFMDDLAAKLCGSHYVIRQSPRVKRDFIWSQLQVARLGPAEKPYLELTHSHRQRSLAIIRSQGFAMPVLGNIYAALRVEHHDGIELLAVRAPSEANPRFYRGFMIGLDSTRTVYDSAVLIVPQNAASDEECEHWEALGETEEWRFTEAHPAFVELLKSPDLGRAFGEAFREDEKSRLSLGASEGD